MKPSSLKFNASDQQRSFNLFGANCGPGAIAAICDLTPFEVLSHMLDFDRLRATTEIMLQDALTSIGVEWRRCAPPNLTYGILRVQWNGPWMFSPDPYEKMRHSHWIGWASDKETNYVFDINAIGAGGWIPYVEWSDTLVPLLVQNHEPECDGLWHFCDAYEVAKF